MKIKKLLDTNIKLLLDNNKEEKAAYELIKHHLKIEPYQLYERLDNDIDNDSITKINNDIKRYLNNEPLQYILGYEYFLGYEFNIDKRALIPRYETEELVEHVLYAIDDYFNEYDTINIADIGCGSGAIAISLDLEDSKTKVFASDISKEALELSCENNNKLKANVTFIEGDMLEPYINNNIKVDILISNPPYIPNNEVIMNSVKDYEPNIALFGGMNGIDFYDIILKNASSILNKRSLIAFEIGYNQKELLIPIINKYFSNSEYEIIKDINGKDRILMIFNNIERNK